MGERGYVIPGGRASLVTRDALPLLWRDGACRATPPKWWQPEMPEPQQRDEAAMLWDLFCSRCPVMRECLQYALEHRETGIWAGTTERIRRRLRRQQKGTAA
jgi:WhiB family redox-sensing transcriptional regulator